MTTTTYYVQEVIGGWKQNAIFQGTFEECLKFMSSCFGNYSIVSDHEYEVDYLYDDDLAD